MTDPPTDADLAALLDEERGAEAARARTTQRWMRQQALEEARLTGVLLSAAEHHEAVTVRTTSGRSYTGTVVEVGEDFAAIAGTPDALTYISLAAITLLQSDRSLAALLAGDARAAARRTTLQNVLADSVGERPSVAFACAGQPDLIPGQLVAVGLDVATLVLDERRRVGYVSLSSVTEVLLRASG